MSRVPRAWMKPLDKDYKAKPLPERKRRPWQETAWGRAVMVPIRRLDPYVRWSELVDRMVHGVMLNTDVFKEVHEDDSANLQALTVVLIVAVVQNISLFLVGLFWFGFFGSIGFVARAMSDAMVSWVIWLIVAYALCKVLFRSRAGFLQVFRTLAYAYVPAIFLFFQVIPLYGVTLAALTYLAPDSITACLCLPTEARESAESGSPWLPEMTTALCERGSFARSPGRISRPSGMLRRPRS